MKTVFLYLSLFWLMLVVTSCEKNIPSSAFTDARNGRVYATVKIGELVWMAENLDYPGNDQDGVKEFCDEAVLGKNFCKKYGGLYSWQFAMKACPLGWHLPKVEEWKTLFESVGGQNVAKIKLMKRYSNQWVGGSDDFGFAALPAGIVINRLYNPMGAYYWTSTKDDEGNPIAVALVGQGAKFEHNLKFAGISVRCLQDK